MTAARRPEQQLYDEDFFAWTRRRSIAPSWSAAGMPGSISSSTTVPTGGPAARGIEHASKHPEHIAAALAALPAAQGYRDAA